MNIKSSPIYFYVQRNTDGFNTARIPIPFDVERLNVGGAMNLTSGKFTAPLNEIYAFSFTGRMNLPGSSSGVYFFVDMYLNGNQISAGRADHCGANGQSDTFSFHSTLNLQNEDQIWLEISQMSTGTYLTGALYTQFSGYLLEENILQSFREM